MPVARNVWLPILVFDARVRSTALDHPVGVLLPHRMRLAGLAAKHGGGRERVMSM
jgi:hypothetical protein